MMNCFTHKNPIYLAKFITEFQDEIYLKSVRIFRDKINL